MDAEPPAARAAARARIAEENDRRIREAVAACGPGATAYAYWRIADRTGIEPDRIAYCCRRPEHSGWKPEPEIPDGPMPTGPWASPTDAYGVALKRKVATDDGRTETVTEYLPVPRYVATWSYLEEYRPLSEWQLEERRRRREANATEREATDRPLFADQIRGEGYAKPPRRGTRARARRRP